ncbi:hypothetical protein D3C80_1515910 [compost metagenome]
MRMGIAEAFAGAFEGIEHRRRATAVEMSVTRLASQVMGQVRHRAFLVVEVVDHLGIEAAELLQQRRFLARSGAVDQLGGFTQGQQLAEHAVDRGDTDATGDQHVMTGVRVEGEVVARLRDVQLAADAQLLMNERRTAAAVAVAQDANHIATLVAR